MSGSQEESPEAVELTDKQRRFIEEYPKDCNKAAAARRAGYEPQYAAQMGYENYIKPYIRKAIDQRMRELAISGDEALKNVSDMATTRLNDFLVVRQVQGYEQVEMYVSVLAAKQREEIEFIEEFAGRENIRLFDSEGGLTAIGKRLQKAKEQLLEYELEMLHHGKDLIRLVAGKPIAVEVADLDLVAIARAKEEGRIKSYKLTKDGVSVEMYDALAANRDLLKIDGRFVDRVEVKDTTEVDYSKLSKEALAEILNATQPKQD
ncbi:terminase small subunit [Hymenobacter guriensis]|uniref:Terminase small subunit n=1 Tax=Hymenobacter guriensis TaxID=2793065 RepID=A0ABS0L7Q0_9BACT|nr:terminase small subunit [Hymenobacter guriensis]MBG8556173.1 terminase small subunit [Hymenobacter guriensis]